MLENVGQIWEQYSMYIVIVGFVLLSFIYTRIVMGRAKGRAEDFLQENPNASKVYVKNENSVLSYLLGFGKYLNIESIDGKNDIGYWTKEGKDKVYYLIPGEHKLELAYQSKRPGILHRSVTKTYQSSDVVATVEENKSYILSFNKKEKNFAIENVN